MQPLPHHMLSPIPPPSPSILTSDVIQKYLDENRQLILAILENIYLGKLSECAQYQALLQRNLLFLAVIADAQHQAPEACSQLMTTPAMQQESHYMQPAPILSPQPLSDPQQLQELQQQQYQFSHQPQLMPLQGHIGMAPGLTDDMQADHREELHCGPSPDEIPRSVTTTNLLDVGGAAAGYAADDGHWISATEHGSGDATSTHLRMT